MTRRHEGTRTSSAKRPAARPRRPRCGPGPRTARRRASNTGTPQWPSSASRAVLASTRALQHRVLQGRRAPVPLQARALADRPQPGVARDVGRLRPDRAARLQDELAHAAGVGRVLGDQQAAQRAVAERVVDAAERHARAGRPRAWRRAACAGAWPPARPGRASPSAVTPRNTTSTSKRSASANARGAARYE